MNEPTFWQNLRAWLKEEKTRFDFVDRLRAILLLAAVMVIVKLLLDLLYR